MLRANGKHIYRWSAFHIGCGPCPDHAGLRGRVWAERDGVRRGAAASAGTQGDAKRALPEDAGDGAAGGGRHLQVQPQQLLLLHLRHARLPDQVARGAAL